MLNVIQKLIVLIAIPLFLFSPSHLYAKDKITVMASIPPLQYFVEQIGKDRVDVFSMMNSSSNPHVYEPSPKQLAFLNKADIYIKVGSGIEFELAWMNKIIALNPKMLVCNSSKGIFIISSKDPHVWSSVLNAKTMAMNIFNTLVAFDPEHDSLDVEIRKKLAKSNLKSFIVFHPSWAYFARDYGLEQMPIEVDGKEPSAKNLEYIISFANKHNIKTVITGPQFNHKSADVVAKEIKGRVEFVDNLSKDYVGNIKKLVEMLSSN